MNFLPVLTSGGGTAGAIGILVAYIAVFAVLMYFLSVRPQKKRQKKMDAMLANLAVGDSILTTSGFYGVVIDISEEVVVVEFGSDRHCRIPMQKEAIVSVEKANEEE
ncbi:MAG: preprotein translocase subunit YajC [Coprococcus sp.]